MPTTPAPAAQSLAASLRPLMRSRKERLSLGELIDGIEGHGGLGPVLFVLTLPVLLPLPPGVSMLAAAPLLVVAPQLIVGRQCVWLPKALERRTVKRPELVKLLKRILPLLERVEKQVHPRLGFLTGRIGACVVGVACTIIALVLVLPIPFANLVPSLALGLFSLGLTRKDGLLVLAGYGLMIAAVVVIDLGVHGFTMGFSHLKSLF
jgi:hypothetical protein